MSYKQVTLMLERNAEGKIIGLFQNSVRMYNATFLDPGTYKTPQAIREVAFSPAGTDT